MENLIKVSVGLVLVINTPNGEEIVLVDNDDSFGIPESQINLGESALLSVKRAITSIGLDISMDNLQYTGTGEYVDSNGNHNIVILFSALVANMTKLDIDLSDIVLFSINKSEISTDLPSISEATKLALRVIKEGSFIPFSEESIRNAVNLVNK